MKYKIIVYHIFVAINKYWYIFCKVININTLIHVMNKYQTKVSMKCYIETEGAVI